jgi:hypothetical protein
LYRRSLHSEIKDGISMEYCNNKTNYFILCDRRCVVRRAWKDDGMPDFSKIRVSVSIHLKFGINFLFLGNDQTRNSFLRITGRKDIH